MEWRWAPTWGNSPETPWRVAVITISVGFGGLVRRVQPPGLRAGGNTLLREHFLDVCGQQSQGRSRALHLTALGLPGGTCSLDKAGKGRGGQGARCLPGKRPPAGLVGCFGGMDAVGVLGGASGLWLFLETRRGMCWKM